MVDTIAGTMPVGTGREFIMDLWCDHIRSCDLALALRRSTATLTTNIRAVVFTTTPRDFRSESDFEANYRGARRGGLSYGESGCHPRA
jgi:hypothetical protein